ncbi:DUF2029 domain-containing protein [Cutibacterium sp. WCA-380-WT-3A]|uniref:DUF2029 domain-containing protein n=1 Tax=Cutibacterium porci TaxID=2605781 RepID=A0A7K0J637_9ACTN|nr:glycosyltransferase family 87 protein [Cutibacterium porci]MSS45405.1 DUF2029 domain-containing protein [Cutibacterium porci]
MLHVFIQPSSNYITGDVQYYLWWMSSGQPDASVLPEYPLPVVWFMRTLYWAGGDAYFPMAFATTMLLLDAILAVAMWHDGHRAGALWWIVLVPLLGPIMWNRFDMVPAVCMGLGALWYRRHPAACGVMIALGAATKLWPALLILPMISRHRATMRRLIAFTVTGFGLALASLLAGGWNRLISPLTWQADRGLQIESVPATVPMLHYFRNSHGDHTVKMSKYNAYEIFGPRVAEWQSVSSVLMVLAVALAVGLAVVAWRRNGLDHRSAVIADLVIIGALVIANKTLSPQYFVWWAAPTAMIVDYVSAEATGDVHVDPDALSRARTWCSIVAVLMALTGFMTQLEYPLHYSKILHGTLSSGWLLISRNVLVLVTFAACIATLIVSLRMHMPAPPTVTLEKPRHAISDH